MVKKKSLTAGLVAGLLLTAVSTAAFTQVSVEKRLSTGKVDIRLEELTLGNGETDAWKDGLQVMPGMTVSKIPRIYNDAADCYVRASVEISGGEESGNTLSREALEGISGDWIRKGDYYYYTRILKSGESTELFQGIIIPSQWEQGEIPGRDTWQVQVRAEAIQAEHLEPDFDAEDPWGARGQKYTIETARTESPLIAPETDSAFTGTVVLDRETEELLADPEDFVGDFQEFLPGDIQERHLRLENHTGEARTIYFRSETDSGQNWMTEMRQKVTVISGGEETTDFEGAMTESQWTEYRQICRLDPGQSAEVVIRLSMPESLGNQYSVQGGTAVFQLCADEKITAAKTGDSNWEIWVLIPGVAAFAGMAAAGILWSGHRKGGKR